ncbi:50S ribosomal protein L29 [bacterium]|nr:50S ribosomal protein L29 [bacterium]
MKAYELREMTLPEIQHRQRELEEEYFNLRMQSGISRISNPNKLTEIKREIARINTILREYELGIRKSPSDEQNSPALEQN